MSAPVTTLRTQEEVTLFLRLVHDQVSMKPEAVKVYAEALSALRTGKADKSFVGDYAESNKIIIALAGAYTSDEVSEVTHGRTTIRYSKTNDRVITGWQMFNTELEKAKIDRAASRAGELSEAEIEGLKQRIRGDAAKRADVLQQNSTIIQMIVGRLDLSYLENLRSASQKFKWGADNQCLLSLIEGLRNFVANPNAEVSPDAANNNRDRAESELRDLQLGIPIQINHFRMKTLINNFIDNVRRTSSSWSDSEIMRLVVKKLDQDNLFKDIELNWSTDTRYSSCSTLDLFWKILEADFNAYAATRKGIAFLSSWRGDASEIDMNQVNMVHSKQSASGGFSNYSNNSSIATSPNKSLNTAVKEFDELQKCNNHIRFVMGHTKEPCGWGSSCKFAHIWMNKPDSGRNVSSGGMQRAKRVFDKVTAANNHNTRPTREQAKQMYKHFKGSGGGGAASADQGARAKKGSASVYFMNEEGEDGEDNAPVHEVPAVEKFFSDESEFDAFFAELLRGEDDEL